jgi:hypothetical protein
MEEPLFRGDVKGMKALREMTGLCIAAGKNEPRVFRIPQSYRRTRCRREDARGVILIGASSCSAEATS